MYNNLEERKWIKGDLHLHTETSDGRMSRKEMLETLREHKFDFCAISDHDVFDPGGEREGIILLPSNEFSSPQGHILALFAERPLHRNKSWTTQQQIDAILDAGGLPILTHPRIKELTLNQSMVYTSERLLCELYGYHGIEIYTHNVGSGFATAVDRLDAVWTGGLDTGTKNLPVWGYASSDAHATHQISPNVGILVDAPECTPSAIRSALENGRFYCLADSLARFEEIILNEKYLHVCAANTMLLRLECCGGDATEGRGHRRLAAVKMMPDANNIELNYQIKGYEGYIRIEAMDCNGHFAYTNPISISRTE